MLYFYLHILQKLGNLSRNQLVLRDGREMVTASGKVGGHGRQVSLGADLQHQVHADDDVEQEVAMEQPEARVVSAETDDDVAVVGDSDGVLRWREVSLFQMTLKQTSPVEVESVLQVDLLYVLVGRPADTDDVVGVSVQVERVR